MSTFNGVVSEFPGIRIDYFHAVSEAAAPLAYFLSHIHSDHCKGLEAYKSPAFIYCSSATRALLLKQEKYSNRRNYDAGILEAKQNRYKHLRNVLRPLPLNTPVDIHLTSSRAIRVTLFDANHCPGAVMFLIEDDVKSILYTGDIRAESWWVEALRRNPLTIPYSSGLLRLDKIYLDTSNASKAEATLKFPSKATGLRNLLSQIARYPKETVFHINCWTLGYEEALSAVAAAFSTKIHVERYKAELYSALSKCSGDVPQAQVPHLTGFDLGNGHYPGALTESDETVRFHACDPYCDSLRRQTFVRVTPAISKGLFEDGAKPPLKMTKKGDKGEIEGIIYPFARHSSYQELCDLVECFGPDEVYPCVVPEDPPVDYSMAALFGEYCASKSFAFDHDPARIRMAAGDQAKMYDEYTQESQAMTERPSSLPPSSPVLGTSPSALPTKRGSSQLPSEEVENEQLAKRSRGDNESEGNDMDRPAHPAQSKLACSTESRILDLDDELDTQITLTDEDFGSQTSMKSNLTGIDLLSRYEHRKEAYRAAKSTDPDAWAAISMIPLAGRFEKEEELG